MPPAKSSRAPPRTNRPGPAPPASSRDRSPTERRSCTRSRSPSPDRDPGEPRRKRCRCNYPEPADWSAKKGPPDPYGIVAREITRTINMFWEPRQVITAGAYLASLDTQDEIENEMASAEGHQKKLYEIFDILNRKLPDFTQKLTEGEEEWKRVRQRLDAGKGAARTEDNFQIKSYCPSWRQWNPALKRNKKTNRGLGHEQCAAFLRPATVNLDNEAEFRRFRVEHDPPATAETWPALCYNDAVVDPRNFEKGLFYSELMIKTGRIILYPPTVASAEHPSDTKSNRKPKADVYDMETVTPGFIAYVAVALRYTLSDETAFMESSGTFNYVVFYNDIVTYLESEDFVDKTEDLIEWWNERIFPRKQTSPENSSSMLTRLREQRAEAAARDNRASSEGNDE